jgi:hypothetical protein
MWSLVLPKLLIWCSFLSFQSLVFPKFLIWCSFLSFQSLFFPKFSHLVLIFVISVPSFSFGPRTWQSFEPVAKLLREYTIFNSLFFFIEKLLKNKFREYFATFQSFFGFQVVFFKTLFWTLFLIKICDSTSDDFP